MSTQQASPHGSVQLIPWDRHARVQDGIRRRCLVWCLPLLPIMSATKARNHVACSLILGMDGRSGGSLHGLPASSSCRCTSPIVPLSAPSSLVFTPFAGLRAQFLRLTCS